MLGLFKKKKKAGGDAKQCFKCKKPIKGNGFTKANGRYCCEQCCSDKSKKDGTCEFC